MKRMLVRWQWGGFLFVSLLGTLLHFLFDLTGQSVLVAPFAAVNESIWEHMKILFVPMFLFALIEHHTLVREYPRFWCAKLWGCLVGVLLIAVLYYTISGVFGNSPDWVNIAIYYTVAATVFWLEGHILKFDHLWCKTPAVSFVLLCAVMVLFAVLTFFTPKIPLFADPIDGTYGI